MFMTSEMSLYFMILSADVVDVKEGDAFTCMKQICIRSKQNLQKIFFMNFIFFPPFFLKNGVFDSKFVISNCNQARNRWKQYDEL